MDRDNNNIANFELISVRGPKTPARQVLVLTATMKGHNPRVVEADTLAIEERQPHGALSINGFWPAMEYLNSRYPYPPVYLGNVVQDALIRSIVSELEHKTDDVLETLKAGKAQSRDPFFIGLAPTLLDLAAAAYSDLTDPFWINHFNTVAAFIKDKRAA